MTRKFFLFLSFVLTAFAVFFLSGLRPVFAQTESLKKAVDGVQESVNALVNARDEKISNDLALRLETLKKVLDLSISEARDLKAKILLDDGNKSDEIEIWKNSAARRVDNVLAFLRDKHGASGKLSDVETVKNIAADFKLWREKIFIPLSDEINDYSTIQKTEKVLAVARSREVRIREDLKKINKKDPKSAANLEILLKKAGGAVNEGEGDFKSARSIFYKTYVTPVLLMKATSAENILGVNGALKNTSSSFGDGLKETLSPVFFNASGTASSPILTPASPLATTTIFSSVPSSTSESSSPIEIIGGTGFEDYKEQTITNLARSSFQNIREAYQIFIEMSNLVRKLF